jgi:hypothetical protein
MVAQKRLATIPSQARMSFTKLSLGGNNLIIPAQGEFGKADVPAGDGNVANLFLRCHESYETRQTDMSDKAFHGGVTNVEDHFLSDYQVLSLLGIELMSS